MDSIVSLFSFCHQMNSLETFEPPTQIFIIGHLITKSNVFSVWVRDEDISSKKYFYREYQIRLLATWSFCKERHSQVTAFSEDIGLFQDIHFKP